jgi:hypothetical protein
VKYAEHYSSVLPPDSIATPTRIALRRTVSVRRSASADASAAAAPVPLESVLAELGNVRVLWNKRMASLQVCWVMLWVIFGYAG